MLKSVEDANKYKEQITDGCVALADICVKAGLYKHAAIFHGIAGAINDDPEEMETVSDLMGMYAENRIARGFKHDNHSRTL
jgi:hypothetical protein